MIEAVGGLVIGALGVAGYFGWRHNREEIERAQRQQRIVNFILVSIVVLLVAIDVGTLVYFLNHTTPYDDSFTSLFRRYVERLLNLESRKPAQWDNQTVLLIALGILLYVNCFFFGLAIVSMSGRRNAPLIHIGDNNCCSAVANVSVGAAAATIVIALGIWSIYRNLPM
jgi:hypothetical protein